MTTEKIAAALSNPGPAPAPLPNDLAELPATVGELTSLASFADVAARRAGKLVQEVHEATERARATARERLAQMSSLTRDQRDRVVAEEAAKARRAALAASEKARYAAIHELQAAARRVESSASLFASPAAMLAREGLGVERRTQLQAQLAGAGPVELRNMALLAVSQRDLVLGAAVLTVLDRMPSAKRPASTVELAARLVGDQHREATMLVAAVRNRLQDSINANRALERCDASADGLARIRRALNRASEGDVGQRLTTEG